MRATSDRGPLCFNMNLEKAASGWALIHSTTNFSNSGQVLNLAARHKDGRWLVVYLASKALFSIQMDKLKGSTKF
jgi:hypothetical protein